MSTPIRIAIIEENAQKIADLISRVQLRCTARLLSVGEIFKAVEDAEKSIRRLTRQQKFGCRVLRTPETPCNAYMKRGFDGMFTTTFIAVRGKNRWFLESVDRTQNRSSVPRGRSSRTVFCDGPYLSAMRREADLVMKCDHVINTSGIEFLREDYRIMMTSPSLRGWRRRIRNFIRRNSVVG